MYWNPLSDLHPRTKQIDVLPYVYRRDGVTLNLSLFRPPRRDILPTFVSPTRLSLPRDPTTRLPVILVQIRLLWGPIRHSKGSLHTRGGPETLGDLSPVRRRRSRGNGKSRS